MYAYGTASCSALIDLPKNWICVPMLGKMTASFYGSKDDAATVENFLAHYIESQIANGTIRTDEIQKVAFLGQQTKGVPSIGSPDANEAETQPSSSGSNSIALATSLTVGIMFVFLILFAAIRRGRQTAKDDSASDIDPQNLRDGQKIRSIDVGDDEEGNVTLENASQYPLNSLSDSSVFDHIHDSKADEENPPLLLLTSTMTTQPTSHGNSSIPATSTMMTLPTSNTTNPLIQTKSPKYVERPGEERQVNSLTLAVPTTLDVSAENITNTAVVDVLPPKPPGSNASKLPTGASKSMKVNRKKKKKKKQKLVRVNSREQIAEMATITEEKDLDEDEEGSEYSSYSTDDDDSRTGSRENSPCRSNSPNRSNPRSREPSPSTRSRSSVESIGNVISACNSSGSLEKNHVLETIDVPFPVNIEKEASQSKRHWV